MRLAQTTGADDQDGLTSVGSSSEEHLSAQEVRRRAVIGAAVDVLRGLGVRFLGLIGMVVLARLVTPRDFGLVAVGATFVTFANFVSDGGIGTALIRRAEPPARADLKAVLAFQLVVNVMLALTIAVVLLPFGELGEVTAVMVLALPLTVVRVPGVILSERQLNYRPLAVVEIVETICYYSFAIGMVALAGWGVWALALASVVRALAGSVVLFLLIPTARMIPVPSWARVRPLLGFGVRYQSVGVVHLLRDQGINVVVGLVLGVSALGLWSVAFRILQVPLLFLASLWRVSFPGMSRLVASRENIGDTIERVVAVVAVASGVILAPLVAASPALISVLLGAQWTEAATVIPPASLNLMIAGPISVALVGYLWAVGDASAVLRSSLAGLPPLAIALVTLLPVIGVSAVGVGWVACGAVESVVLIVAARRRVDISVRRNLVPPVLSAVVAAVAGWFVAAALGTTLVAAICGAGVALLLYVAALSLWHRRQLMDTVHLLSRGMRGAFATS